MKRYLTIGFLLATLPLMAQSSQPNWVNNPYTRVSNQTHLAAVGVGNSRTVAEQNALARLAATFGLDIHVDDQLIDTYLEVTQNGRTNWLQQTQLSSDITTAVRMNNLIGTEILEFWHDGRGNNYALAVMNKINAERTYSELIRINNEAITNLTNIPASERNSLSTLSRLQLAAVFADMNISYAAVLSVLGSPVQELRSGDDFRHEAEEIRRQIPIRITVQNDRDGNVYNAFNRTLTNLGFRTGGFNTRYVLNVEINLRLEERFSEPLNMQLTWATKNLRAELIDTATGQVLLAYHFNSTREARARESDAVSAVFRQAAEAIDKEYADILLEYLTRLFLM
ncbi:MAG: LPP20 family lipoprotein [Spirochaetaceae bacterium]|nr:LPP20 family lipoprotein [Spirochaetaceae bacterium]